MKFVAVKKEMLYFLMNKLLFGICFFRHRRCSNHRSPKTVFSKVQSQCQIEKNQKLVSKIESFKLFNSIRSLAGLR